MTEQENNPAETEPAGENEATELREKWLRALADRDNLRKRSAEQTRSAVQNERKAILTRFLPVLDSLECALQAHEGEQNDWVEGTQQIFLQVVKIFKDYGVEPIHALDRPFDPNLHEAVSQVRAPDMPENTVVEVLQVGYRFSDNSLLRPAKVVVSGK